MADCFGQHMNIDLIEDIAIDPEFMTRQASPQGDVGIRSNLSHFSSVESSQEFSPIRKGTIMDQQTLAGANVAILLTDGFEQVEFTDPRQALEQQGAATKVISTKRGKVQGFHHDTKADQFDVDLSFQEADPKEFDAVLLPGGVMNGDQIRIVPEAQHFVQEMEQDGKPIAAICHGGWLLVSAGLVEGRTLTSWPTLQDDIRNAGGNWVDQEVVVDGNLVTSRKPGDIPAFNQAMTDILSQRLNASARGTRDEQSGIGLSG
jgi:protease I